MYFNQYSFLIMVLSGVLLAAQWTIATSDRQWARKHNVFTGAAPFRGSWPVYWAVFGFAGGMLTRSLIYWTLLLLAAFAGAIYLAKNVLAEVYQHNGGNPERAGTLIPLLVGAGFFAGWIVRGGFGWILSTVLVIGAGCAVLLIGRPKQGPVTITGR